MKKKIIFTISIILIFFVSCSTVTRTSTLPQTQSGIKINAYFSKTTCKYSKGDGIDQLLITDILHAKEQIHLAIYALTNDRIRDALIQAHQKGVEIKIITDDYALYKDDMKVLRNSGIPIQSDEDSNALMHNKFMIIDNQTVWTGSCNYTYHAFYCNNENLVKITGSKIAQVYETEFQELLQKEYKEKAYISKTLEIYFSPEDDFEQRLIALIDGAKESIDFLAFAFTNKDITDALLSKFSQGIKIRGVFDEKQNHYQSSSKYNLLKKEGLNVKLDGNKFTLHDKVFIIDHKIVITGSYNFTVKANETNNENSIVVFNNAFAKKYQQEFEKIFTQAKDPTTSRTLSYTYNKTNLSPKSILKSTPFPSSLSTTISPPSFEVIRL